MRSPSLYAFTAVVAALALGGCNLFSSFDDPDGDEQLLSAARACFDRGDLECAKTNYQKLSASSTNVALSEQAYVTLQQSGMGMAEFMEFVGNGAQGKALTALAERMIAGAGLDRRLALRQVLIDSLAINGDTELQGFVEFLSSLALLGEMMAEIAGPDGILRAGDIVADPTCKDVDPVASPIEFAAKCAPAAGFPTGAASGDIATEAPNTAIPTADQIYWSLDHALDALGKLAPGGDFAEAAQSFSEILAMGKPSDGPAQDAAFRQQLLKFGIGEVQQ
ncbi:MAG: hypothetical protein NDJ90_12110 [Oligoflexia bacterium]|nr:hypothetical protein [Oligoflexia bacterium]